MKNYVKEEATDLDEDEVEATKDLVKTKMSISASIESHRYHSWRLQRICSMQWTTYEYELEYSTQEWEGAMSQTFNDYFTKRSHLKEQLEAVEANVKEADQA